MGSKGNIEEVKESVLIYKLDCRRDKLPIEMVNRFDEYVAEFCGGESHQEINAANVNKLDWKELVNRTVKFIEKYSEQYKELSKFIIEKSLPSKLVRLCWNEEGWQFPSGEFGKSKTTAKSFEKEKGYGYEEWFFDTEKQIDGYHYSFLQPFNKGDHEGEKYDIHLYSLKNVKNQIERYWIGRIKCLEVLTKEEAKNILNIYKEKGWYNEMIDQLRAKGIEGFNFGPVEEDYIFNVRYKVDSSNVIIYEPYRVIEDFKDEVGSGHYVLLDKKDENIDHLVDKEFVFKEGHNPNTRKGIIQSNYSKSYYQKSLRHKEIQEAIYNQLSQKYSNSNIKIGTEQPTGLGKAIDLVAYDPEEGYTFYEIKTGSSALSCIREAMGQVLEYCYYPTNQHACKLVIISPYRIDLEIKKYMRHLREVLGIKLYYQYFSLEKERLEELQA